MLPQSRLYLLKVADPITQHAIQPTKPVVEKTLVAFKAVGDAGSCTLHVLGGR